MDNCVTNRNVKRVLWKHPLVSGEQQRFFGVQPVLKLGVQLFGGFTVRGNRYTDFYHNLPGNLCNFTELLAFSSLKLKVDMDLQSPIFFVAIFSSRGTLTTHDALDRDESAIAIWDIGLCGCVGCEVLLQGLANRGSR